MTDLKIFARLECYDFGQVLITIQNDGGPCVTLRVQETHGIEPKITLGPWLDTDDGWEKAERAFREIDMEKQGRELFLSVGKLIGRATND